MKWCIIHYNGDLETIKAFDTKEEALAEAEHEWSHFTTYERKHTEYYIVGTCNVEEYAPGKWQFAELDNGCIDSDIYVIAKEF